MVYCDPALVTSTFPVPTTVSSAAWTTEATASKSSPIVVPSPWTVIVKRPSAAAPTETVCTKSGRGAEPLRLMPRPVRLPELRVPMVSVVVAVSSTYRWSVPLPPSRVTYEAIPVSTPPMPVWVELTRTVSSPAWVDTCSGPLTVRMTTVSLPAPVASSVVRAEPACVLSTVNVSLPEPSAIDRSSNVVYVIPAAAMASPVIVVEVSTPVLSVVEAVSSTVSWSWPVNTPVLPPSTVRAAWMLSTMPPVFAHDVLVEPSPAWEPTATTSSPMPV